MKSLRTRRQFSATMAGGMPLLALAPSLSSASDENRPVETLTITEGDLKVILRDNSQSPSVLSGMASLCNQHDAPDFNAFDPDNQGASAGLNFEHIISGHKSPGNSFTPRRGTYRLLALPDGRSAMLVRREEDDPRAMSSTLKYTVTKPHYIDVDFRCIPHDTSLFGRRGYAILFFANYVNNVEDVALQFRGVEKTGQDEKWVKADAPKGHPDWRQGGTYRSVSAADLQYDADHNFTLNSWSYDSPRFSKPFYFGKAGKGMVYILMFSKIHTEEDEIRFSLFKFKLPRTPRPAWDSQYVIRKMQEGKQYGFKARLVWKKFVSPEDCLKEYEAWATATLGP